MRELLILLFLGSAFCYNVNKYQIDAASVEPYIFEDLINSTIEGLRADIPETIEGDYAFTLPEEEGALLIGDASISNLKLTGLHDFQLTALTFTLIGFKLDFTLKLPVIDFYTDFHANLSVPEVLAIYGDGNATVHIEDFEIGASAAVNLTGGISIADLSVQLYLGGANFDFHGLFNDEQLSAFVSSLLNDVTVTLLDENQELISQVISPIIQTVINTILGELTSSTSAPSFDGTAG